jgi:carboxylesterase type B
VGFHLLYKPSWPYFRNAIMQSGNPADIASHLRSPKEASKEATAVGKKLGCNIKSNSQLFKCLQSMSTEAFYLASSESFSNFVDLFMPLVLDPDVFSQQPKRSFILGDFKRCNLLIGTNTLEFLSSPDKREYMNMTSLRQNLAYNPGSLPFNLQKYYETYSLTDETGFYDKMLDLYGLIGMNSSQDFSNYFVEMITDQSYKCPAYWLAEQYSEFKQNVYVYLYGHKISTSDMGPDDGAAHGEELSIVFAEPVSVKRPPLISWNSHSATTHNYSVAERVFTEEIVSYWTSFIKNDDPNNNNNNYNLINWPLFKIEENNERNLLFLKAQNISINKINISEPKCSFWNL